MFRPLLALIAFAAFAQQHGVRPERVIIRNVMVVDGTGTPARGQLDVTVAGNKIEAVGPAAQPIEWVIRDGVPFRASQLMSEVQTMVEKPRKP